MEKSRIDFMGSEDIKKLLFKLGMPIMIGMLFTALD